jgi:putative ABC transport system permease protein
VRGFLNGLQGTLISGVSEGGLGALQVHATGFLRSREGLPLTPTLPAEPAFLARLQTVPGVKALSPRIPFAGIVADTTGERSGLAIIQGVDLAREAAVSPVRARLVDQGAWPRGAHDGAISAELARALGIKVGDKVAVLSNDVDGVLNGVEVTITATLSAPTMAEKKLLLLPVADAQSLLRMTAVTEVAVAIDAGVDVDVVADGVRTALGPTVEVHSWRTLMPFAEDARRTQDAALLLVTAAFLVVVLMGVANTLLMNTLERTQEIGTLLALGMRRKMVMWLFLLEGAVTAAVGVFVGSLLGAGVVFALSVNGVMLRTPGSSAKQLIVPYLTVPFSIAVFVLVVLGAVVASLLPSWRASRLDPVQALSSR